MHVEEFVDKRTTNHSQEKGHKGDPNIHGASCAWNMMSPLLDSDISSAD
jgi:hypothetical protein